MKPAMRRSPSRIDWQKYVGFPMFTSNQKNLGKVQQIFRDNNSGEHFLGVTPEADNSGNVLCIPVGAVGVISSKRLLLDATDQHLIEMGLERYDWASMERIESPEHALGLHA